MMTIIDFLSAFYDDNHTEVALYDWRGEHRGDLKEVFCYALHNVPKKDDIVYWQLAEVEGKTILIIRLFSNFKGCPIEYHGQDDLDCPF